MHPEIPIMRDILIRLVCATPDCPAAFDVSIAEVSTRWRMTNVGRSDAPCFRKRNSIRNPISRRENGYTSALPVRIFRAWDIITHHYNEWVGWHAGTD